MIELSQSKWLTVKKEAADSTKLLHRDDNYSEIPLGIQNFFYFCFNFSFICLSLLVRDKLNHTQYFLANPLWRDYHNTEFNS